MIFVDKTTVTVSAGDGGEGKTSFRHEKFVDRGGPDGGDGGNGGDVIFISSRNQDTLANYRFHKELKAESGLPGGKQRKHGKSGSHLVMHVPVGTIITNVSGSIIADLTADDSRSIVAHGGKGGYGNAHFISSTRQAPRIAEKGEPGESFDAILELKIIADVGLVGLPNAGKSTLLSVISNARPEIADYPFTTLTPNLGVVDFNENRSLLFADIPGLIEGAAEGKGLGDEFLKHIERTSVLIHLIDAYQPDVVEAYKIIQKELQSYKIDLTNRPQAVVVNKVEGLPPAQLNKITKQLKEVVPRGTPVMAISAISKLGLNELLRQIDKKVQKEKTKHSKKTKKTNEQIPVITLPLSESTWQVNRTKRGYRVTGKKIERFADRTNFSSDDGLQRLKDIMKKMGILHELSRQGAEPGIKVTIGDKHTIEY